MAFKPKMIRIVPARISMLLVGIFLHLPPSMKPKDEFINVITVINNAGFNILFPHKAKEIPAEKASMLVAIPINNKQPIPMQQGLSFLLSKASLMNLIPKNTKIVQTIIPAKGAINVFTNCVK